MVTNACVGKSTGCTCNAVLTAAADTIKAKGFENVTLEELFDAVSSDARGQYIPASIAARPLVLTLT